MDDVGPFSNMNIDGPVKSQTCPVAVIPANAGTQKNPVVTKYSNTGFHHWHDFLRGRPNIGNTITGCLS